eukprot:gene7998-biopygen1703
MAEIGDKFEIEKLDRSNWPTWKFQMKHLLMAKDVWDHVDGTISLPDDNTASRATYEKAKQKAMATLVMGIQSNLIYLVTSCETPKDLWDTLKAYFERDTIANKLFLKRQYFTSKMLEGQSVQDHLKRMKEIADKLHALGSTVAEEEQVVALLISLPPSYTTLVTALEAKGDELSLAFVQQALINEEQKKQAFKATATTKINRDSALHLEKGISRPFKGKCYNCGKEGHKSFECHKRKQVRPSNSFKNETHNAKTAGKEADDDSDSQLFLAENKQTENETNRQWILDSGASQHMTSNKLLLINYREFNQPELVKLGDGQTVEARGSGRAQITMETSHNKQLTIEMDNVLYVPKLACNLFSVRAVTQKGLIVQFGHTCCWIKDSDGKAVGKGRLIKRMYVLSCETDITAAYHQSERMENSNPSTMDVWHQRLGHINRKQLLESVKKKLIKGVAIQGNDELNFCTGCAESKMSRKPFKSTEGIKTSRKLQIVHSDVCGPMSIQSFSGKRYFVTFIDDYSRCVKVYFIRKKSEVLKRFKEFEASATNEAACKIGTLRTDNGGEYVSNDFENLLKRKGIKHETSVPHSPQQNGVAERMNRTLVESAKAMMNHAGLSKTFWAEAVNTAAYIRNRVITSASGQTPYEKWYGKPPDVSHFRVFGCIAYAHIPEAERRKLDKKANRLRFLGYSANQKGYRLFDMQSKRIVIRRDVNFNENDFGSQKQYLKMGPEPAKEDKRQTEPTERNTDAEESHPRRSQRSTKGVPPPRFGLDEYADVTEARHVVFSAIIEEPATIQEAFNSEYSAQWKEATESEYQSLIENQTWELVKPPKDRKAIGCKWVFKVKYDKNGQVERFKSRLVAKGYSQKYGVDFDETFSPVVRFSSIRALLAFAVQNRMLIHQMDVTTAFLNGDLTEEIYMEQPEGYVIRGKENLVCRLKKSLYGLKQSPRCWNRKFRNALESLNFRQGRADPCIFVKGSLERNNLTIIAVYVDDLIIISTTQDEMKQMKVNLRKNFKMKDLGSLHFCLGVSVEQGEEGVSLSQKQYIEKLLKRYGLQDANPVCTPLDPNVKLVADDGNSKPVDNIQYQSMIGSLLYAAIATRPDIAQAVGALSQFNSAPTEAHLTAVKRVFRYLKGTINLSLVYKKSESKEVTGFSDASWADDMQNRHSTTGNVFMMAGGAISWLSQKQSTVALSTAEAEYIASSKAAQEVVWLKQLFREIGDNVQPITIMEDNQGAISMTKNPVGHKRTKHIDIRYHFVREQVEKGTLLLKYCNTKEMLADLLTKSLNRGQFEYLRCKLGMQ